MNTLLSLQSRGMKVAVALILQ